MVTYILSSNLLVMSKPKIALITGGSSGIGYATAKKFIEKGFMTIITGRDIKKINYAAQELGDHCTGIVFDMECLDRMPGFVQDIYSAFGSIDVLVNNAGVNQKKALVEVTDCEFENIIKIIFLNSQIA